MLGTSVRIGEACAIRQAVLDLKAGTVHINATVVRVDGAGLQIQPRTKTAGSERILHLPPQLVRMLKRRRLSGHPPGPAGIIFTSPSGLIRDPSNTEADLRQALARAGYPWVSSHVFRTTVASRLDDAGYGIRHIADQLGHSRPSTTMDYYLGRRAHHDRLRRRTRSSRRFWRVSGSFLVRFWFAPTAPKQNPLTSWAPRGSNPEPTD
jgi:integrase